MERTDQQPQQPTLSTPAEQITGFRIVRRTEVAPGWWGTPTEVGETGSATVAYNFCTEQNKVTMNPNRQKRIEYYADPIIATFAEHTGRLCETAVTA